MPLCGAAPEAGIALPAASSCAEPRLFSTEFEVNVVVLLHADHLITENFPLKLCRT